jgi:hypothetical protein
MSLTPAARENSILTITESVIDSLAARATIMALPFLLAALAPSISRFYRYTLTGFATAALAGAVLLSGAVRYENSPGGYYGVAHRSSDQYAAFFNSPSFQSGAVYRVLEPSEREDGMYRFIRHGAVLSNEFFTESVNRRSWTEAQYGCYGAFKRIDFVVVEASYLKRYHINEDQLLQSLVQSSEASVVYRDAGGRFTVYDVRNFVSRQNKPSSLKQCGVF